MTGKMRVTLQRLQLDFILFSCRLFIVFNEENELALIQKFFDHIMDVKPHIFVTYNGKSSLLLLPYSFTLFENQKGPDFKIHLKIY